MGATVGRKACGNQRGKRERKPSDGESVASGLDPAIPPCLHLALPGASALGVMSYGTLLRPLALALGLALLVASPSPAPAQARPRQAQAQAAQPAARRPIAEELQGILDKSPVTRRTSVSVQVMDADSGQVLFDHNSSRLMTPASVMKVYTSAAALAAWGAEHRFTTEVLAAGTMDGDTLRGDLILRGGGDPVLTSENLRALVRKLRDEVGLKRITGSVYVDGSLFGTRVKGPGWMWDDDPEAFNMSVTALMIDYNVLTLRVQPGAGGKGLAADLLPKASYPPIVLNPDATAKTYTVTRAPFRDVIEVSGAYTLETPSRMQGLTMHDPLVWGRSVFEEMLISAGIEVSQPNAQPATTVAPEGATVLATNESKPLSEILALFNKPSENAIGEMLLLNLAVRGGFKAPEWKQGSTVIGQWLQSVPKLEESDFRLEDGSGLSRYNLICASGTVKLLRHVWQRPDREVFCDSLPQSGRDGTLRGRGGAQGAKVQAKTGTMSGVSCLAGYVRRDDGRNLVFAITCNGFVGSASGARGLQDLLTSAMAASPLPAKVVEVPAPRKAK